MKFAFYTLGCKVNQYETQAMEQRLRQLGHCLGSWDEVCDGYIINTCTVTAVSDRKSRTAIRQARRRNPDAVIGVCGCYSQTHPEDIRTLDVDILAGTADRMAFLEAVADEAARRQARPAAGDGPSPADGAEKAGGPAGGPAGREAAAAPRAPEADRLSEADGAAPESGASAGEDVRSVQTFWERAADHRQFEALPAGGLAARTRAMLNVEDGCANFCAYCIIPYARGPVRSLPVPAAVEQARTLAAEGYRELVVTGIELSSWGRDLEGAAELSDLLRAVCRAVPAVRVRLGSLEPRTVTDAFCRAMAGCANLCPQFHLSMQSGCDTVLQRMRRRYTTAEYLESVERLRRYFPGCAVTTDWIVGFPGETEAEFRASVDFVRRVGFAQVHVFPYSRRAGTPAAAMPGQIARAEKARRAAEAGAAAAELSEAYRRAMVGTVCRVLFEQEADGWATGHAENYVPVRVPAAGLHNRVCAVTVTAVCPGGVEGRLADG